MLFGKKLLARLDFYRPKPLAPLPRYSGSIQVERDGVLEKISVESFEKLTGAAFVPRLEFADAALLADLVKRGEKLHKKGLLSQEQLWFGSYYRKEIETPLLPDLFLRWIDPSLGWGVFANRDFKKREFIAEYAGKLRRWKKEDNKNSYCFEYAVSSGIATPYTIDAQDQGGIARFINHSAAPNLTAALATVGSISHVILYASGPIPKGAQLCYDYGPDYWSKRSAPLPINGPINGPIDGKIFR